MKDPGEQPKLLAVQLLLELFVKRWSFFVVTKLVGC